MLLSSFATKTWQLIPPRRTLPFLLETILLFPKPHSLADIRWHGRCSTLHSRLYLARRLVCREAGTGKWCCVCRFVYLFVSVASFTYTSSHRAGTGFGGFVFPFLIKTLLDKFGFAWMCRAWSGLTLVVFSLSVALLRPRVPPPTVSFRQLLKGGARTEAGRGPWLNGVGDLRALINPLFLVMVRLHALPLPSLLPCSHPRLTPSPSLFFLLSSSGSRNPPFIPLRPSRLPQHRALLLSPSSQFSACFPLDPSLQSLCVVRERPHRTRLRPFVPASRLPLRILRYDRCVRRLGNGRHGHQDLRLRHHLRFRQPASRVCLLSLSFFLFLPSFPTFLLSLTMFPVLLSLLAPGAPQLETLPAQTVPLRPPAPFSAF
jgi:hypothetical protein